METRSPRKRLAAHKASDIEELCTSYSLVDIWCHLKPLLESYTWRNKSHKIQCRLELTNVDATCKIFHAPETDHSAISLHLQARFNKQRRGPGFWKFNSSLIEDDNYVNVLRKNIDLFKAKYENVEDKGLKWDLIKMEIRGFTVKYAKTKAKRRKNEELTLQNKINELQLSLEEILTITMPKTSYTQQNYVCKKTCTSKQKARSSGAR